MQSVNLVRYFPLIVVLLPILIIIGVVLKGYALWHSARDSRKWWFIAILVINSLGILPIVYLLTHQKPKKKSK